MDAANIDWGSKKSHLLLNPSYSVEEQKNLKTLLDSANDYPGHIWLSTSGSHSAKWVGLSKEAILTSASAVNKLLQITSSDSWIQCLPEFHVGGLGIRARSALAGIPVFDFRKSCSGKWEAGQFADYVNRHKGTVTSLVPAQLYDLIRLGVACPPSLRSIIIGGGALSKELYREAIEAGWPILTSYGMTECSSQIATGKLTLSGIKCLEHVEVKIVKEHIALKSSALLSAYATNEHGKWNFFDPKIDSWFLTNDRGLYNNGHLQILGRGDRIVKIGGENVDLSKLEQILIDIAHSLKIQVDMALLDVEDIRLGKAINLYVAHSPIKNIDLLVEAFNKQVLPFERIRQFHHIETIPKSALQKINYNHLRNIKII